ncbi:MAG: glycogen/starch synthase, partial [Pseudomonadota bacterium]
MRVLSVASECVPLVKTGGLADVVGALPAALAAQGVEMRVMLPAYPGLADRLQRVETQRLGPDERLLIGEADGLSLVLFDAPELFARDGAGPYASPDRRDWPDNWRRFGRFSAAAALAARDGAAGWRPDVVHAHDWQAGLVPAYLHGGGPPVVLTLHNIAFQGLVGRDVMGPLGLPDALFTPDIGEFHGLFGMLKTGIALARRLTTVSPTYARELLTPEFGQGLDGLLRAREGALEGVLNGIDTQVWNPATDPAAPARYDAADLTGKADCRAALAARFGIEPPSGPLFAVISRLTRQK